MDYSNNHFYDEEKLMMVEEYEGFIDHRSKHNYFIEKIYEIYQKIIDKGLTEDDLNNLKVLIIEWLVNYINGDDKKFIETIK